MALDIRIYMAGSKGKFEIEEELEEYTHELDSQRYEKARKALDAAYWRAMRILKAAYGIREQ